VSVDLLISGATVIDGGGGGAFAADVAIDGDRVVQIRRVGVDGKGAGGVPARAVPARAAPPQAVPPQDAPATARTIDGTGFVLAPGFIDVHTHSDLAPFTDTTMDSALRQGVTTVVVGNCGMSAWPRGGLAAMASFLGTTPEELPPWGEFGEYLDAIDAARPACNVAALVGFGSLRTQAMGHERRPATPDEVAEMRRLLGDAVQSGAFGLSTGLIYVPDMYASTAEVADVAAAAAPYGALYATHMRAEGHLVFDAVREAVEIAARAGVHAHVSHLKLEGRRAWGRHDELLALLVDSGATGDQYPYAAWETDLSSFLPMWAPVGQLGTLLEDAETRARLVRVVEQGEPDWESSVADSGWGSIVLEARDPALADRDMAAVAAERGVAPIDLMFDLLLEDPEVMVRGHTMNEDDVRAIVSRPDIIVGSDGMAVAPGGPLWGTPLHPRSYGTFPRVLGRYVRDAGLLSLEAAVRKMTALPAETFGLKDRGLIAEGAVADLVLFDPATVMDGAEFGDAHRYPEGVAAVIVGGRVAWDGDRGERAGRAVRRA
jgi:N-acyl-D-aspartate/D-glutamate deacylase